MNAIMDLSELVFQNNDNKTFEMITEEEPCIIVVLQMKLYKN